MDGFLNTKNQSCDETWNESLSFKRNSHVMEGIRSYCVVPLIARGQSIGVMILLSSRRHRYSLGHVEFLRELSIPAALAINSLTSFGPNHWGTRLICPGALRPVEGRQPQPGTETGSPSGGRKVGRRDKSQPVA